ncbi:hypothetical protein AAFF_G00314170 [Aldrovandia affinis]|uniref:Small membrane A-kinase anchor protein n=1 Tax=Aldrovandia affinis TaxID=143900 RepID=A0AAD7R7E7_9TELE|nr:hypothetical protein AAFF_G00314170 [Aldrovandia affinis]
MSPSGRCDSLHAMGCLKSKPGGAALGSSSAEKGTEGRRAAGERVALIGSDPGPEGARPVDPVLLEYAQRLSQDIVARAVQQWAELDSRYSDIPYIECEVP